MIDNSKYCIEWTSPFMLQRYPNSQKVWGKWSGPYTSLRRANQAMKDIKSHRWSSDWRYRVVHYHKGNY